jgi:hypothetical protein
MVNYNEGKIYKIVNDVNDIIYIGSTTAKLAKRMTYYRTITNPKDKSFYNAMKEIGTEHFKIILVKNFPCNSKAELAAEEYKIMKEYEKDNVELYNLVSHGYSTKIIDDENNKRFRIRYSPVKGVYKDKNFRYSEKEKEEALKEAEAFLNEINKL